MDNRTLRAQLAGILMSLPLIVGCMSMRHTSSLLPSPASAATLHNVQVRIAAVSNQLKWEKNINDSGRASVPQVQVNHLVAIALQQHPSLFSQTLEALPLTVLIYGDIESPFNPIALIGLVTLGVIPTYDSVISDVAVRVMAGNEVHGLILDETMKFRRKDAGWFSLLPTAWIPVPGRSDFPRTIAGEPTLFCQDLLNAGWSATQICCVEAIVRALQQGDRAKLQAACQHQAHCAMAEKFPMTGGPVWCRRATLASNAPADPVPDILIGEIFTSEPNSTTTPVEKVIIARRISADHWRATSCYLAKTPTLCIASAIIENGKPVRAEIREVKEPPLEDFLDITHSPSTDLEKKKEFVRWRTGVLLQSKNYTLPRLLKDGTNERLQGLLTRTEKAILDYSHAADQAKNSAQLAVERNVDPSVGREFSLLFNERLAVLNAILKAIKEELANRAR